ncbi:conserved hypothetical protein [Methanocella paludicola SANAE]|uniref:DUF1614 domain-containing protein n=1 Tax=Methanocella paludicola (strain DSM 17711 / JCM 13418 / NBRC 101707 / SANAE) TaxID=304371 RepID=D1Z2G7_METPS|nr:conserved hypothetical protein [Methanocella paludicola SANAE]
MKKLITFPLAIPFFILLLLLPLVLLAAVALLGLAAADVVGRTLGLSPIAALMIYIAMLAGGLINIPVYEFKSPGGTQPQMVPYLGARHHMPQWLSHRTVVSLNVGGCIIPAALSAYFVLGLPPMQLLATTIIVTLGVFYFARPVRSVGVMVPVLVPPLLAVGASLIALYIGGTGFSGLARLAFASGVFGTIIGADVLHLGSIRKAGSDFVSIGGAGIFDGIVLTGVIGTIIAAIITSL